jgi:hypothetical protein
MDRWPQDLARLSMPVRILGVQGDSIHPWEVARTMAQTIPGARLVPRALSLSPEEVARQWLEAIAG